MAHAVAEGVRSAGKNIEIEVKRVDYATSEDLVTSDGVILGSPCYYGSMSWKMKKFLDDSHHVWGKVDGKLGAAFCSAGGIGGGAEITLMSLLAALINFGFLVFGVTDYVADQVTLHYGAVSAGEPRRVDLMACRRLGERMAQDLTRVRSEVPA